MPKLVLNWHSQHETRIWFERAFIERGKVNNSRRVWDAFWAIWGNQIEASELSSRFEELVACLGGELVCQFQNSSSIAVRSVETKFQRNENLKVPLGWQRVSARLTIKVSSLQPHHNVQLTCEKPQPSSLSWTLCSSRRMKLKLKSSHASTSIQINYNDFPWRRASHEKAEHIRGKNSLKKSMKNQKLAKDGEKFLKEAKTFFDLLSNPSSR